MCRIVSDFMSISDLCFDASGRNIWVHDCKVWNQDDSVAVKDDSENVLIERIEASGIGLAIGSIGCNTVNNVTFKDVHMHHTWKGIYLKFRGCQDKNYTAKISNVYFENIYMDAPEQFAIWIGPAQVSKITRHILHRIEPLFTQNNFQLALKAMGLMPGTQSRYEKIRDSFIESLF